MTGERKLEPSLQIHLWKTFGMVRQSQMMVMVSSWLVVVFFFFSPLVHGGEDSRAVLVFLASHPSFLIHVELPDAPRPSMNDAVVA